MVTTGRLPEDVEKALDQEPQTGSKPRQVRL